MADVKTAIHHIFLPETLPSRVELPNGTASKYTIRRGDVLLNRTSETADELACCSVALNDQDAVYSAYLKRLRPFSDDLVDPRYAAAYFQSRIYRREIERVSFVYTTRSNLNLHQLSQVRFYYPDIAWQHTIGELFSSVVCFHQEHPDTASDGAINRFIQSFVERFVTYPILLFMQGDDRP